MNKPVKEKIRQPYMDAAWFAGLMDEVRRSSKTAVAERLGVHRTTISCVCNGSGEYGTGYASTQKIEIAYRRAFEQLTCPHTEAQVGIAHCREIALHAAPTHNPIRMAQWQACQQCQYKPGELSPTAGPETAKPIRIKRSAAETRVPVVEDSASPRKYGNAANGTDAETEGWETMGGPNDNPYPVEDSRSDYWEAGRVARVAFDRKERQRWAAEPQQAGVIDVVTLPLPEVGGPQVEEVPA